MTLCLPRKAIVLALFSLVAGGLEPACAAGPERLTCTLIDTAPDFSRLDAVLENEGASLADLEEALKLAYSPRPFANTEVRVAGMTESFAAKTDSEGTFSRTNLAEIVYALYAPGRRRGMLALGTGREARIRYPLEAEILILGRVVDAAGNPIEGAEVTATPEPLPQTGDIKDLVRSARSQKDGTFVITNITPANVWFLAGYLRGGDPTEFGQTPFFIKLEAKAERYTGTEKGAVVLPPISEEVLGMARKLIAFVNRRAPVEDRRAPVDRPLPEVKGNEIFGVVLVLEKKP